MPNVGKAHRWMKVRAKATAWLGVWWRLFWPLALLASSLVLAEYLKNFNYLEISARELRLPLALALLIAAVVAGGFKHIFQRQPALGLTAGVLSALVFSTDYESRLQEVYRPIKALFPLVLSPGLEGLVISMVFAGLVVVLSFLAARLVVGVAERRHLDLRQVRQALTVAVAFVFLSQLIPAARRLASAWPQFSYRPAGLEYSETAKPANELPDIYYLVFDRYGSQDVLSQQLGFDNSEFLEWLRQRGYQVNDSAKSNYPYTTMSVASTLIADYHQQAVKHFEDAGTQTYLPYHRSIKFSPVIHELKQLGYTYHHIGSLYGATNTAPLSDHDYHQESRLGLLGRHYTLDRFGTVWLEQSPLARFLRRGLRLGNRTILSYSSQTGADMTLFQLDKMKELAEAEPGGRFIFAHVLLPHDPYFFNADGSLTLNSAANDVGSLIEDKFIEQVKFANSHIQQTVEKINHASQNQSIVILQADEGPYPDHLIAGRFDPDAVDSRLAKLDMRLWSDEELALKYGILAAYNLPGVSQEEVTRAADPVNIFRLVLNHYFGREMPYLPRCYFGFPDGRLRPMTYTDITARLTGQPDPACDGMQ
jgi:hypothetical protein